jgi:hypothetical protein
MPKFQNFLMPFTCWPGQEQNKWRNHWSLSWSFREFDWRAPRSFNAWAVDNLWISVEFGEFEGRRL